MSYGRLSARWRGKCSRLHGCRKKLGLTISRGQQDEQRVCSKPVAARIGWRRAENENGNLLAPQQRASMEGGLHCFWTGYPHTAADEELDIHAGGGVTIWWSLQGVLGQRSPRTQNSGNFLRKSTARSQTRHIESFRSSVFHNKKNVKMGGFV